jgi:hypothetical protein
MRIFVTKTDTDLKSLSASLLRTRADAGAALDRVRALNPQIEDFDNVAAGTVLVLPDAPELKPSAGSPIGSDHLAELAAGLDAGLEAIETRSADRLDALKADRTAVVAALRTAAVKRLVESDPALRRQVDAADANFKADQQRADDDRKRLAELQKAALAEFTRLQNLFG